MSAVCGLERFEVFCGGRGPYPRCESRRPVGRWVVTTPTQVSRLEAGPARCGGCFVLRSHACGYRDGQSASPPPYGCVKAQAWSVFVLVRQRLRGRSSHTHRTEHVARGTV